LPKGHEFGRIDKTLHTLNYIDDEAKRRGTLTQLNRGEGRHSVARAVFHGKRGELRQHVTAQDRKTSWARSAWC
jgi:TnpA family transposase